MYPVTISVSAVSVPSKIQEVFHGKLFKDNQISNIYCLWLDVKTARLTLQKSEVDEVIWMDLDRCMELVKKKEDKDFP